MKISPEIKERIIATATVYLGPLHTLGMYDRLVGLAYLDYTSDPEIHQRVKEAKLTPIQGGAALDTFAVHDGVRNADAVHAPEAR